MTSVYSPLESPSLTRQFTFFSHFTPSLMAPEVLEEVFTGRHKLLEKLVRYCRSSVLNRAKQFTLLVAPRGFGKTHLIALTYYRLKAQEDLQGKMLLAWMREEEWGITSFLDFLMRVFRALEEEYPDLIPESELQSLYDLSPAEAESRASDLLREVSTGRTLVLLLENLDDVFAGLGDLGQKRLRAYLQENSFISILATSPGLFHGVSRRTSAFFGFFRVLHLDPMDFEEAVTLLKNLAQLRGDDNLAEFLSTPTGRARVRAIDHLARGNHRVYVILSQFLTRQSLDELVKPFLNMLDELTPYYQSRMQLLSPQQRKILEFLVDYRGAAPVKMIAQRGFMSPQSASSQLSDLQDRGYVRSEKLGRETLYELREPLMRFCLEVKRERGGIIGLFVDFARIWYSKIELHGLIDACTAKAPLEKLHLSKALELVERESEDPKIMACWQDLHRARAKRNWAKVASIAEELCVLENTINSQIFMAEANAHNGHVKESAVRLFEYAELCDDSQNRDLAFITTAFFAVIAGDGKLAVQAMREGLGLNDETIISLPTAQRFARMGILSNLPTVSQALGSLLPDNMVEEIIANSIGDPKEPLGLQLLLTQVFILRALSDTDLSKSIRNPDWLQYWDNILQNKPIHALPLRLMHAFALHENGSDKLLLALPIEERQLLIKMIEDFEHV